jgi:hypothetical protein
MKKCPPGVICIENYSMFFFIICLLIIVYLIYNSIRGQNITVNNKSSEKIVIKDTQRENQGWFGGLIPSWPYTNLPSDPLLNPYAPPLRDERYFIPGFNGVPIGAVPINISTNIGAVDTSYRQLGILAPSNGSSKNSVIPLMGRPLFTNRDKWQYYTISNQHNNVKLPIIFKKKNGLNDYGVDQIYTGDIVYVEGYKQSFRATIYENDTIRYLSVI